MAITAADVNARVEASDVAIGAGDYALARVELVRAKVLIVGLPNVVGQDAASITYGREDIEQLLDALAALQAAAAVQTGNKSPLKLFHTRPGRPGSARGAEGIQ